MITIGMVIAFFIGVVASAVATYFVARNNQEKFIAILNRSIKSELDMILASTNIDEAIKNRIENIKKRLS